ncbi:hypothetical protein [Chryseobacterium koreense]|uniref:hypothetical protein n=1 Tax=Chryseobacterium koreense TaxID=232216 RepID=UPI0026EAC28C|nr:hypothetical protein [Chryseobacterium koreense]
MKAIKILLMLLMITAFGTSELFGQTIDGTAQTTKPKRKYTKKSEVAASVATNSATQSSPATSDAKPKRTYAKKPAATVTSPVASTAVNTDGAKPKRTYSKNSTAPTEATPALNQNAQTPTASAHQPTYRRPAQTPAAKIAYTPGNGGTYNGHQVFVGPKGGKYYINKNGNKTYIK